MPAGAFEYVPMIREPGNENYDRIGRLLDGDRSGVVRLDIQPGTFVFFEGRQSIHRVSPIEGKTDRHIALLGFRHQAGHLQQRTPEDAPLRGPSAERGRDRRVMLRYAVPTTGYMALTPDRGVVRRLRAERVRARRCRAQAHGRLCHVRAGRVT